MMNVATRGGLVSLLTAVLLLADLAARSGRCGDHAWQSKITGASGFSDGTTGAVFLPNGGIVSTGQ